MSLVVAAVTVLPVVLLVLLLVLALLLLELQLLALVLQLIVAVALVRRLAPVRGLMHGRHAARTLLKQTLLKHTLLKHAFTALLLARQPVCVQSFHIKLVHYCCIADMLQ
jgi:hypothetical protein